MRSRVKGAAARWRALMLDWRAALKDGGPPPKTVKCPVCGERPSFITGISANIQNDDGLGPLRERHHSVTVTVVCECGARTEMHVTQSVNMREI